MVSTKAVLAGVALAAVSNAANVAISVGKSGLSYDPPSATAAIGDTVVFTFDGAHSVVQADYSAPCAPLAGGFQVQTQSSGAVFSINVTSTDPLWFYCSVSTLQQLNLQDTNNLG
jgi:plastocyanin